jgi:hypothetical protein
MIGITIFLTGVMISSLEYHKSAGRYALEPAAILHVAQTGIDHSTPGIQMPVSQAVGIGTHMMDSIVRNQISQGPALLYRLWVVIHVDQSIISHTRI